MVNWFVWSRVLFVSLSGFTFGYDIGSMSGVTDMKGYRQALDLSYPNSSNKTESCDPQNDVKTAAVLGVIVSMLAVGSLFGTLVAGVLSDLVGRKPVIITGAILVSISGLLHAAAVNLGMVILSRIVGGIGIGYVSSAVFLYQVTSLYVAEISPEELRGRLLSFFTLYALSGTLVGIVMNFILKNFLFGWRISVGVQFVVGTLLALGMILLPRSPRWLAQRHRDKQSLRILNKIYKDPSRAQLQLDEIKSTVSSAKEPLLQTLKYVARWKILQRFLLGFFLFIIGRYTGVNFIGYFSVTILCGIGLPGFVASMVLPIMGCISIFLGSVIIDKLGRKPIFLLGLTVMFISLMVSASLIVAFDLESGTTYGFGVSQKVAGYFVLISVALFVGAATLSVGNVPWIVVGEMFPLRNRGLMISLTNTGFWIALISVNQVSPVLISSPLQISGTLYLFAVVTFFMFLYILLLLPETKGLTLEKIEKVFSMPWPERANVFYHLRCGCFLRRSIESRTYQHVPMEEELGSSTIASTAITASSLNNGVAWEGDSHDLGSSAITASHDTPSSEDTEHSHAVDSTDDHVQLV